MYLNISIRFYIMPRVDVLLLQGAVACSADAAPDNEPPSHLLDAATSRHSREVTEVTTIIFR